MNRKKLPEKKHTHTGVSKNSGTPKWMVKIRENDIKIDDLGGFHPYFWSAAHTYLPIFFFFRVPFRESFFWGGLQMALTREDSCGEPELWDAEVTGSYRGMDGLKVEAWLVGHQLRER